MLPRYSRPEMTEIWSDQTRYTIWLEVETLALEQMVNEGTAPKSALDAIKSKGAFDLARIAEIEAEVKHDVIAFLTCVTEFAGEDARYLHRGMTSNDLLDTAFAVQLSKAGDLILAGVDKVLAAILKRANEHKYTPCVGRSHGIHAEPITFGLKVLSWYAELNRQRTRFIEALDSVKVGKISGPVGTFSALSTGVEAHVMKSLGLTAEPVATQVVSRDRHAAFFLSLAQIGTSIERACVEIRHLQRTEVGEAQENFSKGQKGSSAMPHKKNPILTENLTGLARLLRGYAVSALENVPLWHERDISHSSAERVIAPDACILVDFMLSRFASVVEGLIVNPEKMQRNLNYTKGLVSSGSLLNLLVDKGMKRESAYAAVQKYAMATWDEIDKGGADLKTRVSKDPEISKTATGEDLNQVFDLSAHFKQVDYIFDRVLVAVNK